MNTPLDNLQAFLKEDKVTPVIGAGVSYAAANLPGWKSAIENGLALAEMHRLDAGRIQAAREQLNGGNLIAAADVMKTLLGAPGHPFSNWLAELFGEPVVRSSELLDSIEDLCAPILLTTNYDKLLSARSRLRTREVFDWSDYQEVWGALSRDPRFILHLHGVWNKPETIILSQSDYRQLSAELGYKDLLKKLWTDYHFLFIGCSRDGVMDEDFSTVFRFLNQWFPGHTHQHFILLNERDMDAGVHVPLLEQCNVAAISYGTEYAKLAEFIQSKNPNRDRALREIDELQKEIVARVDRLHLAAETYAGDDAETLQLIKDVLPPGAYWIGSEQLKLLEEALGKTNNSIQSKREQFRFSQGIVKGLVKMGELESQLRLWTENSDKPSALNNDKFINLAIICYECLERLPKDLLEEIRHRAPAAIHPYYFTGYLGQFIAEYRMFQDLASERLRRNYDNDRYFFENLKRLINSLDNVLRLDADVVFPNVAPATIARQITSPGFVFVCDDGISLRKAVPPYEPVAFLPAQGSVPFRDAEIVHFQEEWVVVACTSHRCFRWNPTKQLTAEQFFQAPDGEAVHRLFVTETGPDRVVVVVHCGTMLHTFHNFAAVGSADLETTFDDLVYHSGGKTFYGFNSVGSHVVRPVLYRVSWDGRREPLIRSDAFWERVEHLPVCQSGPFESEEEATFHKMLHPYVQGGLMCLRKWRDKEVVAIRLNINKPRTDADLIAFIDVGKNAPEFVASVILPGKASIAFDTMENGESIDLVCGYLSKGQYPEHLVQWIKGIDRQPATQADESGMYIETGASAEFDICDLLIHSRDQVFVCQSGAGTVYDLNLSSGSAEKLSITGLIRILRF